MEETAVGKDESTMLAAFASFGVYNDRSHWEPYWNQVVERVESLKQNYGNIQVIKELSSSDKAEFGTPTLTVQFQNFSGSTNSEVFVVGFRGTADLDDVVTDLKIRLKFTGSSRRVNVGFSDRADKFYDANASKLLNMSRDHPGARWIFTGHSLGGAIAKVLTYRLLTEAKDQFSSDKIKCITFGTPLVGDEGYDKKIRELKFEDVFHTYVNETDVVPRCLLLEIGSARKALSLTQGFIGHSKELIPSGKGDCVCYS